MSKVITRKKNTGKIISGIVLTILLTAVILLGALAGAAFVIAKGPAESESARFCATLAERRSPFAGLFYSAEELKAAAFYMPPKQEASDITVSDGKEYRTRLEYISSASSAWDAVVITGIDPAQLSLNERDGGVSDSKYAFGLSGDASAYVIGDYLTYRGEEDEIYCFCALDEDGILNIGAKTAYEAANSGYVWGISADRVLMQNGSPLDDLGGGYASRAAIGQAKDGSVILIYANDRGLYPSGITYSELAALMYEYGAVNAAALAAEGAFYADGEGKLGSKSESGFSLTVKGGAN